MSGELTAPQRAKQREQYTNWINRSVGFGVVSVFIGTAGWILTEEPVVLFTGLGLYWLGCLGMAFAYWYSPVSVHDELEQRMERDASHTTLTVVLVVGIIGIPAEVVLNTTGVYTAPAAIRGAIWTCLGVVCIWIVFHWIAKRQYA